MTNYEIVINNQQIFEFYQKNPNLNIEQVHILCIQLFENILQDVSINNNKSINNQILHECLKNNHKLDEINHELSNKIDKLNSDLILKFFDIKKEYIEEVKQIVIIQGNEKAEKIYLQLKENTLHIKEFIQRDNLMMLDKHTIANNSIVQEIENKIKNINIEALEKINQFIFTNSGNIIEKINHFINTTFMQINPNIQEQIQRITNDFKHTITDEFKKSETSIDFAKLIQNHDDTFKEFIQNNSSNNIEQFLNTFEIKYNSLLGNILQCTSKQQNNQDKIFSSLEEFLDRYRNNSSAKGKFAENHLKLILEENIENAEIVDKSQTPHSCDLLLQRVGKHNILIENKVYTHKVPTTEIDKFKTDCIKEATHGIILSQLSKITLKYNYQIDFQQDCNGNKIILVYVNDVKDDFYKIQLAINIIDILTDYFHIEKYNSDDTSSTSNFQISKETIIEINEEFKKIIIQKENMITIIKDFQKKITLSIEEFKLPVLEKYLLFMLPNNNTNITINCHKCKNFNAKTKSALAAHQKSKACNMIFQQNNKIITETITETITKNNTEV
jgi:hypothetical protein